MFLYRQILIKKMQVIAVPVLLLCAALVLLWFVFARRYWANRKQKKVYRMAFEMAGNDELPLTTEVRPQLLSLSGAEDEHFQIEED